MAYQSLNIIGSFTAGIPAVNREIAEERNRADAYRSLMQSQVSRIHRESEEDVADVEGESRMVVGDAPHDRRNPYAFRRSKRNLTEKQVKAESEQTVASETVTVSEDDSVGARLDIVV